MENGSASSLTVAWPRARRFTTDLLVGSDNAENVALSESTTIWLYISGRKSSGSNQARYQHHKSTADSTADPLAGPDEFSVLGRRRRLCRRPLHVDLSFASSSASAEDLVKTHGN